MKMIELLLVDDQSVVRQGLRMRLELEADMTVVGEAGNGEIGVQLAQELEPRVVLMDVEMPHMDGIAATAALRATVPTTRVVMLSMHDTEQVRADATAAGAVAFISKEGSVDQLLAAIRAAADQ